MKNLTIQKLTFGLLMAFVLALGVPGTGIADPLKLTATSDTTQEKRPNDAPFEIKFSVQLNGDTTAYNDESPRRRVTDGNTLVADTTAISTPNTTNAIRIDSSGYQVRTVSGTERRLLPTDTAATALMPTGGADRHVTIVSSPTASHGSAPKVLENVDTTVFPAPVTPFYVDTSGNVYDSNGKAVYIRVDQPTTRIVTRTQDAAGTTITAENVTVTDYKFTQAKFDPNVTGSNPVPVDRRFDYNEEEVRVTVATAPTDMEFYVKGSNYALVSGTDLSEKAPLKVLKSSMTLVFQTKTPGEYTVTIEDSTEEWDYPRGQVPLPIGSTDAGLRRSKITFTLRVTTESEVSDESIVAQRAGADNPGVNYLRVDTGSAIEHISADFTVSPADGHLQIRYKVISGNGTLYAAETSTTGKYKGPTTDLTVHQAANVFLNTNRTTNQVSASIAGSDRQTHTATIVYEYSGSDRTTSTTPTNPTQQPTQPTTPTQTLSLSPTTLSGAAGSTATVTAVVNPQTANVPITFTLSTGGTSVASTNAAGLAQTSIVLPTSNAAVTASATGYRPAQANISVTGGTTTTTTTTTTTVGAPAGINIYSGNDQDGDINERLDEDLVVEVVDNNDNGVSFEVVRFRVVEGSGRLSPTSDRTNRDGIASVSFTPRSPGPQGTVEVEAYLGDLTPVTFTINVGEPPDAIVAVSGNNQSGKPGAKLANPFVVEVIDENDDPVSGVAVTFAVTAGGGSLSTTSATTGSNGRAQTTLTLGKVIGGNTVAARVTGLTGITFKAKAGAQVLVPAAQRPPMYWVDGTNGTLHRLVDAEVEDLATSAKGAMSIAIDSANGYIYWTAQTSANKGAIRRAGINGRGVQTLKTVSALPMGIAVDAAGGTVYWTNARGKILSMPVAGGKVTNVRQNLSSPGPIALSNGVLYWGEATGSIRKMNLTAKPKNVENLVTGLGEPLAISIAKGKIYWIERGGGGSGKLQRANTNGQNIQQLKSFASGAPIGMVVDSSANRIYWTKRTGKIQRANFAGKFIKDIVTGLPNPGSIALGVEEVATTPATQGNQQANNQQANTQQQNNQQASDTSKYDVNGDGAVDNLDVTIVALALGTDNLDYDVNGDGSVDANDLRAVIANSDSSGAAPAIEIDLKAMDIDFNRVQEQIEMLLAAGDISLEGQRVLMYLQHLLASARPDETVLLANYPNPFNPETWIPYHLAESTEVKVNIYDAQGVLVRALTLGHQTAGYYTSRSRAAYWDGRNTLGERVASGIYFYQLQTDAISPMRKMVILK